jgi:hypothetical protein
VTAVVLDRGRLRVGDRLLVSLQRALVPPGPLASGAVPRSHGLAPLAAEGPGFVAAVAADEAVWLGFRAADPQHPVTVGVQALRRGREPVNAVSGAPWAAPQPPAELRCPPPARLAGVPGDGGVSPFGTGGLPEVLFVLARVPEVVAVRIELVAPAAFSARTGVAHTALDPGAAYGGELLP